eukprot:TRINITY_DN7260_c0_g5_i1.p1 TRINITY_DN7260_c0_g5~~TRINITY_DN7260_c0_g5_i1.p1  ORF type:complete len:303 (+),score=0.30 TRINITY_DN7260_c0_g5_i1:83-991(+)
MTCKEDSECQEYHYCNKRGLCEHKPFFPLSQTEIFTYIGIMIICGLANTGGFGSSVLVNPILYLVLKYRISYAALMCHVFVFGGSLGTFITHLKVKDRYGHPIICYEIASTILPLMIMGATIGVIVNRILPDILVLVGLTMLLMMVTCNLFDKLKKTLEKESRTIKVEKSEQAESEQASLVQNQNIEVQSQTNGMPTQLMSPSYGTDVDVNEEFTLPEDKSMFPLSKNALVILHVILLILLKLIQGSERFSSLIGIKFCGSVYWILMMNNILLALVIFEASFRLSINRYKRRIDSNLSLIHI